MYLDYWVNLSKNKNGRISKSIERKIKTKTGQLYENKQEREKRENVENIKCYKYFRIISEI